MVGLIGGKVEEGLRSTHVRVRLVVALALRESVLNVCLRASIKRSDLNRTKIRTFDRLTSQLRHADEPNANAGVSPGPRCDFGKAFGFRACF